MLGAAIGFAVGLIVGRLGDPVPGYGDSTIMLFLAGVFGSLGAVAGGVVFALRDARARRRQDVAGRGAVGH